MTWDDAPPQLREFIAGLDLGQQRDFSALVIAERHRRTDSITYSVGHIERFPLGTRYPAVVEHVRSRITALIGRPQADAPSPKVTLAIDQTGCGRPVVDLFLEARLGVPIEPITITAGTATTHTDDGWHVAKQTIAASIQIVLQTGRLRISDQLPMAAVLTDEMKGFKATVKLNGNVSFAAGEDWRSAPHDDLVLALGMVLWFGENQPAGWSDIAAWSDIGAFFASR